MVLISIHAPLTGSDIICKFALSYRAISIHAPLTGSDWRAQHFAPGYKVFQSTLPLRGATCIQRVNGSLRHFNPRSPYGERRLGNNSPALFFKFQSTLPLRGATTSIKSFFTVGQISIHAPLTGSDDDLPAVTGYADAISIHAPLTGSDGWKVWPCQWRWVFQSTLPLRGATSKACFLAHANLFQSTLPLRGATYMLYQFDTQSLFQSTLPLRGATKRIKAVQVVPTISIHAPLTGSDTQENSPFIAAVLISIHAPLTGSDDFRRDVYEAMEEFQSTLPLRGATYLSGAGGGRGGDFNPRSPYGERQDSKMDC